MQGGYLFRTDGDEQFKVPIDVFSLRVDSMVHAAVAVYAVGDVQVVGES